MSSKMDLHGLLPVHHRMEDARRGHPLKALLDLFSEQGDLLREDIDRLYDDLFIETCQEWVVPYIGDLVGNRPLPSGSRSPRADTANTVAFRRRRGTHQMLERLARSVTGWPTELTPARHRVGWTQNLHHPQIFRSAASGQTGKVADRHASFHVHDEAHLRALRGPKDTWARTVSISSRHTPTAHPAVVSLHLHPVTARPLQGIHPAQPDPNAPRYHLDPLGRDIPLYEQNRHRPLTRARLEQHLNSPSEQATSPLLGPHRSLHLLADGQTIPAHEITAADLTHWALPRDAKVALDPQLGRIAFHPAHQPETLRADLHHGRYAHLGGGTYPRPAHGAPAGAYQARIRHDTHKTPLKNALRQWSQNEPQHAVLRIDDNATYTDPVTLRIPENGHLTLASESGRRPLLHPTKPIHVEAPGDGGTVILDGLAIQAGIILKGNVTLRVRHCTLAPPHGPAITTQGNATPTVVLNHVVSAPLRLPPTATCTLNDTVLHPNDPTADPSVMEPIYAAPGTRLRAGAPLRLHRCTLLGTVHTDGLEACEDTILDAPLHVQRSPPGCVRHSYLSTSGDHLQGFRCLPGDVLDKEAGTDTDSMRQHLLRLRPRFLDRRPGTPGFARLHPHAAQELHTGASDGGAMGAHNGLGHTHRIADLRARLDETLPLGLRAHITDHQETQP